MKKENLSYVQKYIRYNTEVHGVIGKETLDNSIF